MIFVSLIECFMGLFEFAILAGYSDRFDEIWTRSVDGTCFKIYHWFWVSCFFDTLGPPVIAWGLTHILDLWAPETSTQTIRQNKQIIGFTHTLFLLKIITGVWAGIIAVNSWQCPGISESMYLPSVWYLILDHFIRLIISIPYLVVFTLYGVCAKDLRNPGIKNSVVWREFDQVEHVC
jgi:hypothetical protein